MPVDPIVFPQQSGGLFQSTPPTALNIQFSPPELFFNWLMNYPAPGDFISKVIFPDYSDSDEYAAFTDKLRFGGFWDSKINGRNQIILEQSIYYRSGVIADTQ